MMEKKMLIEIVTSLLNDRLCDGCKDTRSPYSYGSCKGGSCGLCRSKAAEEVATIINALPSAQKTGRWEIYIISGLDGEGCRCSECGFEGAPYWDFCPNCGARMEGVE